MSVPGTVSVEQQRREVVEALGRSGLSVDELWRRYFAIGGDADPDELQSFLRGADPLDRVQRDVVAHALNERLDEVTDRRRVPYARTLRHRRPTTGPLAAILRLLDADVAPPEALPRLASEAGREIGVTMTVHVVDYEQARLIRLGSDGEDPGEFPQAVDTTLAGRCFRTGEVLLQGSGDGSRMWLPLLDGIERVGVLSVDVDDEDDLDDPGLREQCWWVASLLGHMITIKTEFGDALETIRRGRPRSVAAELIWSLLPPLTVGTAAVTVAGLLEPAHDVGGDAFDYSVSEGSVSLGVIDATGHGLASGTVTAVALAAYRNARRGGGGLFEQVRAVDEAVATRFGTELFATAVLAELDTVSGRLRYVGAGHPEPLLLRGGRVVRRLAGGRRPMLGLGTTELHVGEEQLEVGDQVLLYSDGVTEARDASGRFFGLERLEDLFEREASTRQPAPEVLRRLVQALLRHQQGVLQDDATLVVLQWHGS
jgi:hypothetical protein